MDYLDYYENNLGNLKIGVDKKRHTGYRVPILTKKRNKTMNIYMAWAGQNATTGKPHPITGRMSRWGDLYIFKSKKSRDDFCDKWNNIHNAYPVPTNRKEAKAKYFAGMTQHNYDMMIYTADWYE